MVDDELTLYTKYTCPSSKFSFLFSHVLILPIFLRCCFVQSPFRYGLIRVCIDTFYLYFICCAHFFDLSHLDSADSPGYSVYTDSACTVSYMDMEPVAFRSTCSAGNDDAADDVVSDNSAPFFVNPPPTVSTTALPGSQDMPASNNYFCTATAPTAKPVFAPTAFPTIAVAAPVSFDVEQVRLRVLSLLDAFYFSCGLVMCALRYRSLFESNFRALNCTIQTFSLLMP